MKRLHSLATLLFSWSLNRNPRIEADLVHLTFYLPGFFGRYKSKPKVATLYDMIPENTPQSRKLWNPHFSKRKFMTKADALVSISNSSTEDMVRQYGLNRDVITTYLGVGKSFMPGLPRPRSAPTKYFLYVGAREGYKDAKTVLKAFSMLLKNQGDIDLLFVGGGGFTTQEVKLLHLLGISEKTQQSFVPDANLPALYSNALGLLYSSRYEGFGLPLVEAMASGIPIFASDTKINKEICGPVGTYFSPGDEETLSEAMTQVLSEPESYSDKVEAGLELAKSFTWHECAKRTAQVYRSVMVTKEEKFA
jgi:glycosyltransferase involved in cell wall biosynthesis